MTEFTPLLMTQLDPEHSKYLVMVVEEYALLG